jgi:small-conductance mechanosensitive channel|tara:strand:- start:866 stop:1072 length:207 start_codon:yes stop_codon:yes gene_type:complete
MDYLEAILQKLIGQKAIETKDLMVYLSNPVAIGEHSDIGEEVEKKVSNIDQLSSKIETIQELLKTLNK